jgi:sulfotransferase family protein
VAGQNRLRVVGAGLGRTGTKSLKLALERLLGAPCYHMAEVFEHREHIPVWEHEAQSERPNLDPVLEGYSAIVDWPGAAFWRELADANPRAVILLSTRSDAETWWRSADRTIFDGVRREIPPPEFLAMWRQVARRGFTERLEHRPAIAAYERHNARVRATADPRRLVEWQPGDGWQPLCEALGVAVPAEPFPHANSTEEFLSRRTEPEARDG